MSLREIRRRNKVVCSVILSGVLLCTGCSSQTSSEKSSAAQQDAQTSVQTESDKPVESIVNTEPATEAVMPEETNSEALMPEEAATEAVIAEEAATEAVMPEEAASEAESEMATEAAAMHAESPFTIFVDDEIFTEPSVSPDSEDPVRVYITFDGYPLLDLPFGEEHTVLIHQIQGAENTVRLTGDAVYMESATCDNQDCVHMGEVTRENLETRVLGGFIVCLPNMIVVEVRGE